MNQLSQIRSLINALRRKMALEISHVCLRPMAEDYCLEWSVAATEGRPAPDDLAFIRKVGAKFRLPTFMAAHQYLQQCLAQKNRSRRRASPGRPASLGRGPRPCRSCRRFPSHARPPKRIERPTRQVGPGTFARVFPLFGYVNRLPDTCTRFLRHLTPVGTGHRFPWLAISSKAGHTARRNHYMR